MAGMKIKQQILGFVIAFGLTAPVVAQEASTNAVDVTVGANASETPLIYDSEVESVQFQSCCGACGTGNCGCATGDCGCGAGYQSGYDGGYGVCGSDNLPGKSIVGVDQFTRTLGRETHWARANCVPWESFAYGEYIGPHRTPHVGEYRLRVNDQLEFVYLLTREKSVAPYQMYVGDQIQISSAIDDSLNQTDITILPDGTISLSLIGQIRAAGKTVADLQRELNDKYTKYVKNPAIVVKVLQGETPLQDLRDSVDARAGNGGQSRNATVSPDGTVQLPLVGSVPAIGLTLEEMGREVNARYRMRLRGIEVTPILIERAPRFIYVVGEALQPGRFELTGPTSAMQAVALAGGFTPGGNLRQIVVFRRDQNWRLSATKLDLAGGLYGRKPHPSDEIWLRDSDIVLIPKKPIQRFSEAVNLYLASSLYAIFPQQGIAFNFDDFTTL